MRRNGEGEVTQTIGGAVLVGLVLLAAGRTVAGVITLLMAAVVLALFVKARSVARERGLTR